MEEAEQEKLRLEVPSLLVVLSGEGILVGRENPHQDWGDVW